MVRYSQSAILGHTKKVFRIFVYSTTSIAFFGSRLVNYAIGPSTLKKLVSIYIYIYIYQNTGKC